MPRHGKLYALHVQHDWNGPKWPQSKLTLEPDKPSTDDQQWIVALEQKAQASRFTRPPERINLENPINAVIRWHKENGDLEFGDVTVHWYSGPPAYQASPIIELADEEFVWRGFFKGPVYGYNRATNRHFVVYSPANRYHWPTCLLADRRSLWIGTRGNGIFRYDKQGKRIQKLPLQWQGEEVLDIESIQASADRFLINGKIMVNAAFFNN